MKLNGIKAKKESGKFGIVAGNPNKQRMKDVIRNGFSLRRPMKWGDLVNTARTE